MPNRPNTPTLVTWDQVCAFRLARHRLLERAPVRDIASIAYDMVGVQAQLLSAAQLSLGVRMQGQTLEDVEQAVEKKVLVKASCMRRTLFLVPAKHLSIFIRGSARRAEKEVNWALKKGVPARTIDIVIDAVLGVLDEPLTRSEISERVSGALGLRKRDAYGGGWGNRGKIAAVPVGHLTYPVVYLLGLVAARGVVCYGPYRDNEPTFVRADSWIPRWKDVSREEAETMLARKYLQAYGPATEADFAMWCGISLGEAREIWAREGANLAVVDVDGWKATILKRDLDKLAQVTLESPHIRLLPYFDTFILGHRDRQHLVDKKHHLEVFRPQGWISPVVLVDGRIAGVWKHTQEKKHLLVQVQKFGSMSRSVIAGLREEAHKLGQFLGVNKVNVQFNR